ncbi:ATP-binding protein [Armatimonas sp.]|uniref:ATP-binding protein n=1 Tax=Armatimonas sp. TaxID=1872638 RepID=UPI00375120E3
MTELLRLRLPTDNAFVSVAREAVVSVARKLRFPEAEREALRLAVGEACNNTVEHGDERGMLTLRCLHDYEFLIVEVSNAGEGALPSSPAAMPDASAEGGRGRALMEALTDSVEYFVGEGQTLVRLKKRLPLS